MRPDGPRPQILGSDSGPESPFPLKLNGKVIKGFGRGSKELGIPTANIPIAGLSVGGHEDIDSGIYYGWAGLDIELDASSAPSNPASSSENTPALDTDNNNGIDGKQEETGNLGEGVKDKQVSRPATKSRGYVFPMVMSIGWNLFFKNSVRTVEVHLLHTFPTDFYDHHINLIILGFIRPEYDYLSKESLIDDINEDICVARRSLNREAYEKWKEDAYLWEFGDGVGDVAC